MVDDARKAILIERCAQQGPPKDTYLRQRVGGDEGARARGGHAQVVHRLGAEKLADGGPQDLTACL